ncbi:MAG: MBL fold metallo-hydrolase [Acidimicrobiia bacterium]
MTFYGVRGSTPCPAPENIRFGGNTACVVIERDGHNPIILDIGTGLRFFGESLPHDGSFRGSALVTHMHWDHIQGLPFFVPILLPGAAFDIYGPILEGGETLEHAFSDFMRPPYFPVTIADLKGKIRFHGLGAETRLIEGATVTARPVPHKGVTNGYRVEFEGTVLVYISDHQQPLHDEKHVDDAVLELCHDADVLIHDAQYTAAEFTQKYDWGHCTIDYALEVARQGGVKQLVLFHHDPAHDDRWLAAIEQEAVAAAAGEFEVIAAYEGLVLKYP